MLWESIYWFPTRLVFLVAESLLTASFARTGGPGGN